MAKLLHNNFTMNSLPIFVKQLKYINPKCNKFYSRHINIRKNSSYTRVLNQTENSVKSSFQPKICCSSIIYRSFNTTTTTTSGQKNFYSFTLDLPSGEKVTLKGKEGDSILDVLKNQEDEIINGYGACDGTISCSTCHVILTEKDFETSKIDSPLTDEELDIISTAQGRCDTSRLGCQVYVTKRMDGVVLKVPEDRTDVRDQ